MEKTKKHFLRRAALLLAMLTLASAVMVGCGGKKEPEQGFDEEEIVVVPEKVDMPVDVEAAQKKWPDIVGYIMIPGATQCTISEGYFVAQSPKSAKSETGYDDEFYLRRDLDGKANKSGTLFIQTYYNSSDWGDPVTVVYGHNMANRTMFGGLQTFLSKMDFSKQHLVYMYQKDRRVTYQIVGGVQYDLSHIIYYHDFTNDEVFNSFFDQLWKETDGTTNLDKDNKPVAGDKVLILSVCKNGDDNHRYLVVCKMIEDTADPTTWPLKDAADGDTAAAAKTDTSAAAKTDTAAKAN